MLELRPNCECCDCDLPAASSGAWICSFECTFCETCAQDRLHRRCPNCGGELLPRPPRAIGALAKYPAGTQRIHQPGNCKPE